MTRTLRLRPMPDAEALAQMYPTPHDHRIYGRGHGERVGATIAAGLSIPPEARRTVADLSCGNGVIARALCSDQPAGLHLGDFAPGLQLNPGETGYAGPLEETIDLLPGHVDLYVCSETLEHLDSPMIVLERLRERATTLLLSTPLECWEDSNAEHLWAWDRGGVEFLASVAGWTNIGLHTWVDSRTYGEPYLYGIWIFS